MVFLEIVSSLSTNMKYCPDATSIPAFRASDNPPFSLCITLIRGSKEAYLSHIFPEWSVDPSSERIISKFL